jgi:phosphate transport system substrate-binding protein
MKTVNRLLPVILIVTTFWGCQEPKTETPTSGKLTVLVSDSHVNLLKKEAEEFNRIYPDANVTVLPTSSREAIVHLLNDSVRCVCVDRPLNREERMVSRQAEMEIDEIMIATDAFGIIVHPKNPLKNIDTATVRDILERPLMDWKNVPSSKMEGNIELAITERNSGAYELLVTHFFNLRSEVKPRAVFPHQSDVVKYVSQHPRAMGFVSAAVLADSIARVKLLFVQSRDTSVTGPYSPIHQATIHLGVYPLIFPLYIISNAPGASLATGFSAYVASAQGQRIFLNNGIVPVTVPVRLIYLK